MKTAYVLKKSDSNKGEVMGKKNKIYMTVLTMFFMILGTLPMTLHASVMNLTESNFNSTVSSGTTVVDFYADWCGPCKRFAPTFEKLSNEMQNVKFAKVNIDHNKGISNKYSISSIPTLILIKDGKEVKRNVGPMSYNSFRNFIGQ